MKSSPHTTDVHDSDDRFSYQRQNRICALVKMVYPRHKNKINKEGVKIAMRESLAAYRASIRVRIVSLVILLLFLFESFFQTTPLIAQTVSVINQTVESLALPKEFGRISEKFCAEKPETLVIHIQDAHAHYGAQSNIKEILEYISRTYGVESLCLEGSEGEMDVSLYRAFPLYETKERVIEEALKESQITGAEEFAILSDQEVALCGIEDEALYLSQIETYSKAESYAAEVEKFIPVLKKRAKLFLKSTLSHQALTFIETRDAFSESSDNFLEFYRTLLDYAGRCKISIERFPSLSQLEKISIYEKNIDPARVASETEALTQKIITCEVLSSQSLEELAYTEIEFKGGRKTPFDYFKYLKKTASECGIDFKAFDAIHRYYYFLQLVNDLNAVSLEKERVRLEKKILTVLAPTAQEKEALGLFRAIQSLTKILTLKGTPDDFRDFTARKDALFDWLKKENMYPSYIDIFEKFYIESEKREDAFIANALDKRNERTSAKKSATDRRSQNDSPVVLVAGGYHTNGILERLKAKNVSYVVVTPRITRLDEDDIYKKIMNENARYFGVNEGTRGGTLQIISAIASYTESRANEVSKMLRKKILPEFVKALSEHPERERLIEAWNRRVRAEAIVSSGENKLLFVRNDELLDALMREDLSRVMSLLDRELLGSTVETIPKTLPGLPAQEIERVEDVALPDEGKDVLERDDVPVAENSEIKRSESNRLQAMKLMSGEAEVSNDLSVEEIAYIVFGMIFHRLDNMRSGIASGIPAVIMRLDQYPQKKELESIKFLEDFADDCGRFAKQIQNCFTNAALIEYEYIQELYSELLELEERGTRVISILNALDIGDRAFLKVISDSISPYFAFMRHRFEQILHTPLITDFDLRDILPVGLPLVTITIDKTLDTALTGYRDGLEFAVKTLIENAFVHGRQDLSAKIYVNIFERDKDLVITIEDNGKGFDADFFVAKALEMGVWDVSKALSATEEEKLDLVFQKRLSRRAHEGPSHGMGTYLAREVLRRFFQNGSVKAENFTAQEGTGARVTITVPQAARRNGDEESESIRSLSSDSIKTLYYPAAYFDVVTLDLLLESCPNVSEVVCSDIKYVYGYAPKIFLEELEERFSVERIEENGKVIVIRSRSFNHREITIRLMGGDLFNVQPSFQVSGKNITIVKVPGNNGALARDEMFYPHIISRMKKGDILFVSEAALPAPDERVHRFGLEKISIISHIDNFKSSDTYVEEVIPGPKAKSYVWPHDGWVAYEKVTDCSFEELREVWRLLYRNDWGNEVECQFIPLSVWRTIPSEYRKRFREHAREGRFFINSDSELTCVYQSKSLAHILTYSALQGFHAYRSRSNEYLPHHQYVVDESESLDGKTSDIVSNEDGFIRKGLLAMLFFIPFLILLILKSYFVTGSLNIGELLVYFSMSFLCVDCVKTIREAHIIKKIIDKIKRIKTQAHYRAVTKKRSVRPARYVRALHEIFFMWTRFRKRIQEKVQRFRSTRSFLERDDERDEKMRKLYPHGLRAKLTEVRSFPTDEKKEIFIEKLDELKSSLGYINELISKGAPKEIGYKIISFCEKLDELKKYDKVYEDFLNDSFSYNTLNAIFYLLRSYDLKAMTMGSKETIIDIVVRLRSRLSTESSNKVSDNAYEILRYVTRAKTNLDKLHKIETMHLSFNLVSFFLLVSAVQFGFILPFSSLFDAPLVNIISTYWIPVLGYACGVFTFIFLERDIRYRIFQDSKLWHIARELKTDDEEIPVIDDENFSDELFKIKRQVSFFFNQVPLTIHASNVLQYRRPLIHAMSLLYENKDVIEYLIDEEDMPKLFNLVRGILENKKEFTSDELSSVRALGRFCVRYNLNGFAREGRVSILRYLFFPHFVGIGSAAVVILGALLLLLHVLGVPVDSLWDSFALFFFVGGAIKTEPDDKLSPDQKTDKTSFAKIMREKRKAFLNVFNRKNVIFRSVVSLSKKLFSFPNQLVSFFVNTMRMIKNEGVYYLKRRAREKKLIELYGRRPDERVRKRDEAPSRVRNEAWERKEKIRTLENELYLVQREISVRGHLLALDMFIQTLTQIDEFLRETNAEEELLLGEFGTKLRDLLFEVIRNTNLLDLSYEDRKLILVYSFLLVRRPFALSAHDEFVDNATLIRLIEDAYSSLRKADRISYFLKEGAILGSILFIVPFLLNQYYVNEFSLSMYSFNFMLFYVGGFVLWHLIEASLYHWGKQNENNALEIARLWHIYWEKVAHEKAEFTRSMNRTEPSTRSIFQHSIDLHLQKINESLRRGAFDEALSSALELASVVNILEKLHRVLSKNDLRTIFQILLIARESGYMLEAEEYLLIHNAIEKCDEALQTTEEPVQSEEAELPSLQPEENVSRFPSLRVALLVAGAIISALGIYLIYIINPESEFWKYLVSLTGIFFPFMGKIDVVGELPDSKLLHDDEKNLEQLLRGARRVESAEKIFNERLLFAVINYFDTYKTIPTVKDIAGVIDVRQGVIAKHMDKGFWKKVSDMAGDPSLKWQALWRYDQVEAILRYSEELYTASETDIFKLPKAQDIAHAFKVNPQIVSKHLRDSARVFEFLENRNRRDDFELLVEWRYGDKKKALRTYLERTWKRNQKGEIVFPLKAEAERFFSASKKLIASLYDNTRPDILSLSDEKIRQLSSRNSFLGFCEYTRSHWYVTGDEKIVLPTDKELIAFFGNKREIARLQGEYQYEGVLYTNGVWEYLLKHTENQFLARAIQWRLDPFKAICEHIEEKSKSYSDGRYVIPSSADIGAYFGITGDAVKRYYRNSTYKGVFYANGVWEYIAKTSQNPFLCKRALWQQDQFKAIADYIREKSFFDAETQKYSIPFVTGVARTFGVVRTAPLAFFNERTYQGTRYSHGVWSYLIEHTSDEKFKRAIRWRINAFGEIAGYIEEKYFVTPEGKLFIPIQREIEESFYVGERAARRYFEEYEYNGEVYPSGVWSYLAENAKSAILRDHARWRENPRKAIREEIIAQFAKDESLVELPPQRVIAKKFGVIQQALTAYYGKKDGYERGIIAELLHHENWRIRVAASDWIEKYNRNISRGLGYVFGQQDWNVEKQYTSNTAQDPYAVRLVGPRSFTPEELLIRREESEYKKVVFEHLLDGLSMEEAALWEDILDVMGSSDTTLTETDISMELEIESERVSSLFMKVRENKKLLDDVYPQTKNETIASSLLRNERGFFTPLIVGALLGIMSLSLWASDGSTAFFTECSEYFKNAGYFFTPLLSALSMLPFLGSLKIVKTKNSALLTPEEIGDEAFLNLIVNTIKESNYEIVLTRDIANEINAMWHIVGSFRHEYMDEILTRVGKDAYMAKLKEKRQVSYDTIGHATFKTLIVECVVKNKYIFPSYDDIANSIGSTRDIVFNYLVGDIGAKGDVIKAIGKDNYIKALEKNKKISPVTIGENEFRRRIVNLVRSKSYEVPNNRIIAEEIFSQEGTVARFMRDNRLRVMREASWPLTVQWLERNNRISEATIGEKEFLGRVRDVCMANGGVIPSHEALAIKLHSHPAVTKRFLAKNKERLKASIGLDTYINGLREKRAITVFKVGNDTFRALIIEAIASLYEKSRTLPTLHEIEEAGGFSFGTVPLYMSEKGLEVWQTIRENPLYSESLRKVAKIKIFEYMHKEGIYSEREPIAMGVRSEHVMPDARYAKPENFMREVLPDTISTNDIARARKFMTSEGYSMHYGKKVDPEIFARLDKKVVIRKSQSTGKVPIGRREKSAKFVDMKNEYYLEFVDQGVVTKVLFFRTQEVVRFTVAKDSTSGQILSSFHQTFGYEEIKNLLDSSQKIELNPYYTRKEGNVRLCSDRIKIKCSDVSEGVPVSIHLEQARGTRTGEPVVTSLFFSNEKKPRFMSLVYEVDESGEELLADSFNQPLNTEELARLKNHVIRNYTLKENAEVRLGEIVWAQLLRWKGGSIDIRVFGGLPILISEIRDSDGNIVLTENGEKVQISLQGSMSVKEQIERFIPRKEPVLRGVKPHVYPTPQATHEGLIQREESEQNIKSLNRRKADGGDPALLLSYYRYRDILKNDFQYELPQLHRGKLSGPKKEKVKVEDIGNGYDTLVDYVIKESSSDSFFDEPADLYIAWSDYTYNGNTEARDQLLNYFLFSIINRTKGFDSPERRQIYQDEWGMKQSKLDLVHEAALSVLEAIEKYDPQSDRGEVLEEHIEAAIEQAIKEYRKRQGFNVNGSLVKGEYREISISSPYKNMNGNGTSKNGPYGTQDERTLEDDISTSENREVFSNMEIFERLEKISLSLKNEDYSFLEDVGITFDKNLFLSAREKQVFRQEVADFFEKKGLIEKHSFPFGMWLMGSMGNIGIARKGLSDANFLVVAHAPYSECLDFIKSMRRMIGSGTIREGFDGTLTLTVGARETYDELEENSQEFFKIFKHYDLLNAERGIATIEVIPWSVIDNETRAANRAQFHLTENIYDMGVNASLVLASEKEFSESVLIVVKKSIDTGYMRFLNDYLTAFFEEQVRHVIQAHLAERGNRSIVYSKKEIKQAVELGVEKYLIDDALKVEHETDGIAISFLKPIPEGIQQYRDLWRFLLELYRDQPIMIDAPGQSHPVIEAQSDELADFMNELLDELSLEEEGSESEEDLFEKPRLIASPNNSNLKKNEAGAVEMSLLVSLAFFGVFTVIYFPTFFMSVLSIDYGAYFLAFIESVQLISLDSILQGVMLPVIGIGSLKEMISQAQSQQGTVYTLHEITNVAHLGEAVLKTRAMYQSARPQHEKPSDWPKFYRDTFLSESTVALREAIDSLIEWMDSELYPRDARGFSGTDIERLKFIEECASRLTLFEKLLFYEGVSFQNGDSLGFGLRAEFVRGAENHFVSYYFHDRRFAHSLRVPSIEGLEVAFGDDTRVSIAPHLPYVHAFVYMKKLMTDLIEEKNPIFIVRDHQLHTKEEREKNRDYFTRAVSFYIRKIGGFAPLFQPGDDAHKALQAGALMTIKAERVITPEIASQAVGDDGLFLDFQAELNKYKKSFSDEQTVSDASLQLDNSGADVYALKYFTKSIVRTRSHFEISSIGERPLSAWPQFFIENVLTEDDENVREALHELIEFYEAKEFARMNNVDRLGYIESLSERLSPFEKLLYYEAVYLCDRPNRELGFGIEIFSGNGHGVYFFEGMQFAHGGREEYAESIALTFGDDMGPMGVSAIDRVRNIYFYTLMKKIIDDIIATESRIFYVPFDQLTDIHNEEGEDYFQRSLSVYIRKIGGFLPIYQPQDSEAKSAQKIIFEKLLKGSRISEAEGDALVSTFGLLRDIEGEARDYYGRRLKTQSEAPFDFSLYMTGDFKDFRAAIQKARTLFYENGILEKESPSAWPRFFSETVLYATTENLRTVMNQLIQWMDSAAYQKVQTPGADINLERLSFIEELSKKLTPFEKLLFYEGVYPVYGERPTDLGFNVSKDEFGDLFSYAGELFAHGGSHSFNNSVVIDFGDDLTRLGKKDIPYVHYYVYMKKMLEDILTSEAERVYVSESKLTNLSLLYKESNFVERSLSFYLRKVGGFRPQYTENIKEGKFVRDLALKDFLEGREVTAYVASLFVKQIHQLERDLNAEAFAYTEEVNRTERVTSLDITLFKRSQLFSVLTALFSKEELTDGTRRVLEAFIASAFSTSEASLYIDALLEGLETPLLTEPIDRRQNALLCSSAFINTLDAVNSSELVFLNLLATKGLFTYGKIFVAVDPSDLDNETLESYSAYNRSLLSVYLKIDPSRIEFFELSKTLNTNVLYMYSNAEKFETVVAYQNETSQLFHQLLSSLRYLSPFNFVEVKEEGKKVWTDFIIAEFVTHLYDEINEFNRTKALRTAA